MVSWVLGCSVLLLIASFICYAWYALKKLGPFSLRQLFAAVTLICIALVIVLPIVRWRVSFISDYERQQLEGGMTKAEVLAICGPPHFRSEDDRQWSYWYVSSNVHAGIYYEQHRFEILFDKNGRLVWVAR